ncbi:MAG: diacylglycerol kinase family protein [Symbiobacteriia bacterium]
MSTRPFHARLREALNGLGLAYQSERNLRLQAVMGSLALAAGFLLGLTASDWLWVLTAICLVLGLELANSAVEAVVDLASPQIRPLARYAKHVAAGAVLMGAVFALAVAALVLWPRLWTSLPGWPARLEAHPAAAASLGLLVLLSLAGVARRWPAAPRWEDRGGPATGTSRRRKGV